MFEEAMMNSEYRRTWRAIMRRGLALSLGLWMTLAMWALPQTASAAFDSGVANTISWFYAAAFGRTPVPNSVLPNYGDIGGVTFWTNAFLAGEGDLAKYKGNLDAIGDYFTQSPEFKTRYPDSMTNEEYVTALYNNMLGRQPEGTLSNNFWVLQLENGATRGAVLVDFANTPENQNKNPERKAALESFIALINKDANKEITPQEAGVWIGENPELDGKIVDKTLAVTKAGSGKGTVTSQPPGISCGDVCASSFSSSSGVVSVTLTAAPESGSTFDWGGFCEQDTDLVCQIEMSAARSVTATFSAIATTYALTISKAGTGTGIVSGASNYAAGALVTLIATPDASSTFVGWSPNPPCAASFAMPANNLTCTATFNKTTSQVAQPTFDKRAGNYDSPQPITITTSTAGAKIRFAAVANGDPAPSLTCTTGSLLNNGVQVMVDRSLTLYAIACLNGQPSEPMSATYTINNPVVLNDTGITKCATSDSYGSDCPLSHPYRLPGQDGDKGRDAWARGNFEGNITGLAKLGGGDAGFDFTKIDTDGNDLLNTATEWSCVRDNVTGLTWEVKTDDGRLQDTDWTYTWYDSTDANGGDAGIKNGGRCYSGSCDTQGYVQAINRLGMCGRTDWRVPTSRELSQLIHYGVIRPAIDTEYFPNTTITSSWAAETYVGDLSMAWTVVMSGGYTEVTVKGNSFARLQLVAGIKQTGSGNGYCSNPRIPATTPTSTFHDNQDGTVTHSATSLMWSRCALGREWGGGGCTGTSEYHNWKNALDEVATRNSTGYLGHNDWRLPNIKELNSITEHCRTNPSINTEVFPDASSVMSDFWSSSSLVGIPTSAWLVDFRYGRVDWTGKSNAYQVLLVRDVQQ